MIIPGRKLSSFVREITNQCFSSRTDRINRNAFFQTYYESGTDDPSNPAMFNKTYSSCDDLESLLYSPISLRFTMSDPDLPNVLNKMKGRVVASRIRHSCRRAEIDTMISQAVNTAMIKGKSFVKILMKEKELDPTLIQPEDMGVLRENYTCLDKNMEAFSHRSMITVYQFERILSNLGWSAKEEKKARDMARNYQKQSTGEDLRKSAAMQVTVGGMYPFQPSSQGPSQARGITDWLSAPKPNLSPEVEQTLLPFDETWMWDDDTEDWATFQMIDDLLLLGRYQKLNALAYDKNTKQSSPFLKGEHPFREFCFNPVADYFWGASELRHLVVLQEAINARIVGVNKMLRKQEAPPRRFTGVTGVNQNVISRLDKPNGYFSDASPGAKVENEDTKISPDLWGSLHEYERMYDDVMGLPPTARGHGEQNVRSDRHARTLVHQTSPRFKDRALLVERSVEAIGGLVLDLKKAHDDKILTTWVPAQEAGLEGVHPNELEPPPAKGMVAVEFKFSDIPEDVHIMVDSHSSSPAFSEEAKMLNFDLVKIGAEGKDDLVEHVDAPDPEDLQMGIIRRDIAMAEAEKQREAYGLIKGKKH